MSAPLAPSRPLAPSDRLGDLTPYEAPRPDPAVTLALDSNEGAPLDATTLRALSAVTAESVARYPDASPLEARLAQTLGVDPARVVLSNGGDDAIDRVCRAILNPGDTLLTHAPGFVMIPRWARLSGARVRSIDWLDGPFPLEGVLGGIDATTRLVALVSPCNPTGRAIDPDAIEAVADRCASLGALLMLDQAYAEFDDADPATRLLGRDHVVIVRTFSKAMGAAGLRLGYSVAPQRVASWLRTVGGPYPVSAPSIALGGSILGGIDARRALIARTAEHRDALTARLRAGGARVTESRANFVLARFDDAASVHASLLGQGVRVRRFAPSSPVHDRLRITVPADPAQMNQLTDALGRALSPTRATP